jgi:hypothetical protein
MTDGEWFYLITNGRGKMTGGEGDRTKETTRWNLVNLVRSYSISRRRSSSPISLPSIAQQSCEIGRPLYRGTPAVPQRRLLTDQTV